MSSVGIVIFGILIVAALIGGIIAIVYVERRKKEEDDKTSKTASSGSSTGGGASSSRIAIQSVADTDKFMSVFLPKPNPIDPVPILGYTYGIESNASNIKCESLSFDSSNFKQGEITIDNALIWNLQAPNPKGGTEPILVGGELKNNGKIFAVNPATNTQSLAYSWVYDNRSDRKTWCSQTQPNLCIDRSGRVKTLPSTITSDFQWNNISVPTSPCTN